MDGDNTSENGSYADVVRRYSQARESGTAKGLDAYLSQVSENDKPLALRELVEIDLEASWREWARQSTGSDDSVSLTDDKYATKQINDRKDPPRLEDWLNKFPPLNCPENIASLIEKEIRIRQQCGDRLDENDYAQRFPELSDAISRSLRESDIEKTLIVGNEEQNDLVDPYRTLPEEELASEQHLDPYRTLPEGHPALKEDQDPYQTMPEKGSSPRDETESKPRMFGAYEIIEEIGSGGMGRVFKARQIAADRIVAIKQLKAEASSLPPIILERFRREAQATSRLDHPGIVTVFDVGEIDNHPYYAMRFVDGDDLEDLCQKGDFSDREAARLILESARALQKAHDCGILHRDLKPMNILVDRETKMPCIADFGLAKLLDDDNSQTIDGDVLGTPHFMSPEQVRDTGQVTTRADIYGLGATLYYLLAKRAPYEGETVIEVLNKASTGDHTPLARTRPDLDRDLGVVCEKAISPDPADRYSTADAFADDLQRWLDGESTIARPLGRSERFFRWCKKNPLIAGLTLATVFSMVVAVVALIVGYAKVADALKESEISHRQARDAVNDFFTTVSEDVLLQEPAMQPLRKELLQRALVYYEKFLNQRNSDPDLRAEIAETLYRIGHIQELIDDLEKARESYIEAEAIQESLVRAEPDNPAIQLALSKTLNSLGGLYAQEGNLEQAFEFIERAKDIRDRLAKLHPDDRETIRLAASSRMNLAILHRREREYEEARREFQESLDLREPFLGSDDEDLKILRDQSMCYYNLANLELDVERIDLARPALRKAISGFETISARSPDELHTRHRLSLCYRLLGEVNFAAFSAEEAGANYESARELLVALSSENPRIFSLRSELAEVNLLLGELMFEYPDPDRSEEYLSEAVRLLDSLQENHEELLPLLVQALQLRGVVRSELREYKLARDDLSQAISYLKLLSKSSPDDAAIREQIKSAEGLLKGIPSTSASSESL